MLQWQFKLDKVVLFILVSIMLLFCNMVSLNLFDLQLKIEESWYLILVMSLIISPFTIRFKFTLTKGVLMFLILWELFVLSVFISQYINYEFNLFEFLLYSLLIPMVFFNTGILKYKNTFILACFVSVIPYIYLLGQWNRLAILITVIGVTVMPYFITKRPIMRYSYIIILFTILFLTGHRTSILSFLIISAIIFVIRIFYMRIYSLQDILARFSIIMFFLAVISLIYDNLLDVFLNKWSEHAQNTIDIASLSSGRIYMWEETLTKGLSMFGEGEDFSEKMFGIYHVHNHLIQVLGAYGTISLIFFLALIFYIFTKIFRLKQPKQSYIFFYLIYFLIGFTEYILFINTYFIYPSILFFVFTGCLINEKKNIKSIYIKD